MWCTIFLHTYFLERSALISTSSTKSYGPQMQGKPPFSQVFHRFYTSF